MTAYINAMMNDKSPSHLSKCYKTLGTNIILSQKWDSQNWTETHKLLQLRPQGVFDLLTK